MRIANGLYLATTAPLLSIHVYFLPPPLEYFTSERRVSESPDTQPYPPYIFQTPLPVYHYSS